jgi:hypothetical protein
MTLAGLSGNLWPIHLKPFPDELLSSWIVRLAHGHGLKLQTFSSLVFGRNKSIWNRDIDKLAPDWLIHKLAECTGTSIQGVMETTLKSYEGVLYEHHQPNGNTKWILPLGVYHRTHGNFGLQFCPHCLAEDTEPYYRKHWRLAFYTECEKHQVLMLDSCPNCSAALNFHRAEMGVRSLLRGSTIHCHSCSYDLRSSPILRSPCQDWRTFTACRSLLLSHQIGWGFIENTDFNYAQNLFEVLRHLCRLMGSDRRGGRLLSYTASQIGFDPNVINRTVKKSYELRDIAERHFLFYCAVWLLLDWPNRFVSACEKINLSSAHVIVDFAAPPYWFISVINDQLSQGQYSPTNQEFLAAAKYLSTREMKVSIASICRLLGYSKLKHRHISFSDITI